MVEVFALLLFFSKGEKIYFLKSNLSLLKLRPLAPRPLVSKIACIAKDCCPLLCSTVGALNQEIRNLYYKSVCYGTLSAIRWLTWTIQLCFLVKKRLMLQYKMLLFREHRSLKCTFSTENVFLYPFLSFENKFRTRLSGLHWHQSKLQLLNTSTNET